MKLTELLRDEAERAYAVAETLMRMVDAGELGWKPPSGKNWMTTGQLIQHCATACGAPIKGFVTGDWGMPEGMKPEEMSPQEMLPPAEKMPACESLDAALEALAEDKAMALRYIDQAGEENLLHKSLAAPWGGPERPLLEHLYHMIGHLELHKAQLFYYLKLQGKDVNTHHLWGM